MLTRTTLYLCTCIIIICDRLREKEQFPAKVDFAIITPKVGGDNFGRSHSSAPGGSRIRYLASGTKCKRHTSLVKLQRLRQTRAVELEAMDGWRE